MHAEGAFGLIHCTSGPTARRRGFRGCPGFDAWAFGRQRGWIGVSIVPSLTFGVSMTCLGGRLRVVWFGCLGYFGFDGWASGLVGLASWWLLVYRYLCCELRCGFGVAGVDWIGPQTLLRWKSRGAWASRVVRPPPLQSALKVGSGRECELVGLLWLSGESRSLGNQSIPVSVRSDL